MKLPVHPKDGGKTEKEHIQFPLEVYGAWLAASTIPTMQGSTEILRRLDNEAGKDSCIFTFPIAWDKRLRTSESNPIHTLQVRKYNMPTAYILLNTEIGAETEVLKALRDMECVKEAFNLWGVYDIIASIDSTTMDSLKRDIKRIERLGKVTSKLAMIITEPETPIPISQVNNQQPLIV